MLDMYKGVVNSPETTITNDISNTDTIVYILDETRVPAELPNLMTLGTGTAAETIKVVSIAGNALTVERGFQGVAKAWNAGTVIARNFTEYDYNALKENVEELETTKETPAGAQAKADTAETNAKAYTNQEVAELAGDLDAHLAESASKHIYESGVNANGRYIKFDDGTVIMTRIVTISTSETGILTFDAPTTAHYDGENRPYTNISTHTSTSDLGRFIAIKTAWTRWAGSWQIQLTQPTASYDMECTLLMIGRWK